MDDMSTCLSVLIQTNTIFDIQVGENPLNIIISFEEILTKAKTKYRQFLYIYRQSPLIISMFAEPFCCIIMKD